MTWTQNYTPLAGSLAASALVAASPAVVLLGLMGLLRVRAHIAALCGLATVLIAAVGIYRMPAPLAFAAAGYGALYGLLPIGWIVLHVIFLYDVTVETGQFEVMKRSIADISPDRRIQALLIAFCFGAFVEGMAGFGAPVAISAAMLIGLGFRPLLAASLALLGNTAPVAFGSLGIPLVSLAEVTGLPLDKLSAMTGRQLPILSLLIPFWLVAFLGGWRAMLGVWPACAVVALTFSITQFLLSNFHGPWLVDSIGAAISMFALLALLRFWRPRDTLRFPDESGDAAKIPAPGSVFRAWLPWMVLAATVVIWGLPATKAVLNQFGVWKFSIAGLDGAVFRAPPLVPVPRAESAVYTLNLVSATGTAPLLAAVIAGFLLGLGPAKLARIYLRSLWRVRWSILTIVTMLALAYTSRYGGLDSTLGLAFASTGSLFPFFSPVLGWLGVALTGSDTASNVLFGNLQRVTAERLGVSPILAAAANSTGGVMGKMIDAQSIVVAAVATGQHGAEGKILRRVFWHSVALVTLAGLLVLAQACWFPGIVPR
ncbi:MAG TPA: L-lactate permease [Candidatus Didemnitutus sp.]